MYPYLSRVNITPLVRPIRSMVPLIFPFGADDEIRDVVFLASCPKGESRIGVRHFQERFVMGIDVDRMSCPACNGAIGADTRFCGICGANLVHEQSWATRKCPMCAERIKREAQRCMHCHAELEDTSSELAAMELDRKLAEEWDCETWQVAEQVEVKLDEAGDDIPRLEKLLGWFVEAGASSMTDRINKSLGSARSAFWASNRAAAVEAGFASADFPAATVSWSQLESWQASIQEQQSLNNAAAGIEVLAGTLGVPAREWVHPVVESELLERKTFVGGYDGRNTQVLGARDRAKRTLGWAPEAPPSPHEDQVVADYLESCDLQLGIHKQLKAIEAEFHDGDFVPPSLPTPPWDSEITEQYRQECVQGSEQFFASRKARRRIMTIATLVVLVVLTGVGVWGYQEWNQQQLEEQRARALRQSEASRVKAGKAIDLLRLRQTNITANNDSSYLPRALEAARSARAQSPTPEARSAYALLFVLNQGWHMGTRQWSDSDFQQADAATKTALQGEEKASGMAEFARALLTSKACRLVTEHDPRRPALCDEAEKRFVSAQEGLSAPESWWLKLELTWIHTGYLNARALEALKADKGAETQSVASGTLDICRDSRSYLDRGAVNDTILGWNCLNASGLAGQYDEYYTWARWLRARDKRDHGKVRTRTLKRMFLRAGPLACRPPGKQPTPGMGELKFSKKNRSRKLLPKGGGTEVSFCSMVGLYALDCPRSAGRYRSRAAQSTGQDPAAVYSRTGAMGCYLAN
jgi:hypothetical protein